MVLMQRVGNVSQNFLNLSLGLVEIYVPLHTWPLDKGASTHDGEKQTEVT